MKIYIARNDKEAKSRTDGNFQNMFGQCNISHVTGIFIIFLHSEEDKIPFKMIQYSIENN